MYLQLINKDTNNIILVIRFSQYLTMKNVGITPSQEGQYLPHQHQPYAAQTMQIGLKGWTILTMPMVFKAAREMAVIFAAVASTLIEDKIAI